MTKVLERTFVWRQGFIRGFPGGSAGKESTGNAGDLGSIPGWGRPSGEGIGYPLQYSCLENPVDRGAWKPLQSVGLQRVGHDCMTGHTHMVSSGTNVSGVLQTGQHSSTVKDPRLPPYWRFSHLRYCFWHLRCSLT